MRLNFTLIFLLLLSFTAQSQKLTGIWRGYFSSANGLYRDGIKEEMYKYELQIDQKFDNGVKGVTYSYKSTVFYGKASVQGIFSPKSKTIIIKETGLLELEIGDRSQPCLMTCYLDYSKIGKLEVLQGTFISVNVKDKGDCGSGKVYLEKVASSDFKPEDFLLKKKPVDNSKSTIPTKPALPNNKQAITAKPSVKATAPGLAQKNQVVPPKKNPVTAPSKPVTASAMKPKPGAEKNLVAKQPQLEKKDLQDNNPLPRTKDTIITKPKELPPIKKAALPKVLVERENNLVRTIITDEEFIQIDLYDNGTIDHDSISVFDNNKQVIKNGGLSYTPITLKIKMSEESPRHEIIMVAENMGEIPPNTALMVITAGKKRYEVFLTSTEEKNAKVVIEYQKNN
ncbi:MAG: hypothetical protein K2Q21_00720 [Chitinophagaceae bacterium]|nr:hypothetical protein [Chitinophagaceae bacterium]